MKKINLKSFAICAAMLNFGFAVNPGRILGDDYLDNEIPEEIIFHTDSDNMYELGRKLFLSNIDHNETKKRSKAYLRAYKEYLKNLDLNNLYEIFVNPGKTNKILDKVLSHDPCYCKFDPLKIPNIHFKTYLFYDYDAKNIKRHRDLPYHRIYIKTDKFIIDGRLFYPGENSYFHTLKYYILSLKDNKKLIHVSNIISSKTSGQLVLRTFRKRAYSFEDCCLEMYLSSGLTVADIVGVTQKIVRSLVPENYKGKRKPIILTDDVKKYSETSINHYWRRCIRDDVNKKIAEPDEISKLRNRFIIQCLNCADLDNLNRSPRALGLCNVYFNTRTMMTKRRIVISDFGFFHNEKLEYKFKITIPVQKIKNNKDCFEVYIFTVNNPFQCKAYFYNVEDIKNDTYFYVIGYRNVPKKPGNNPVDIVLNNLRSNSFSYCLFSKDHRPLVSVYYTPFSENSGYIKVGICDDEKLDALYTMDKKLLYVTKSIDDIYGLIETKSTDEFIEKLLEKHNLSIDQLIYLSQKIIEKMRIDGRFDYTPEMAKESYMEIIDELF